MAITRAFVFIGWDNVIEASEVLFGGNWSDFVFFGKQEHVYIVI